ncbi:MAG: FISUMP domain-containing protein [Bacteroidota bacterium]|nr:FISUMP domain-containing protein [Bacteroidota bacterium]
MKNKKRFMRLALLLMGVFLVFAINCNKDDDDGLENLPVLSTTEVTEITPNTATSGGNITDDGGITVTARGVCWSTNENPTIEDNKTEDGASAGIFTTSVTDLEPNTTYYLRAYATNSAVTGYGSAMSFTTQDTFTDLRDGKVYQTVVIGNQEWMAENLAYASSSGNFWAYDNDDANLETYGYLYDWETACDVCPDGWHLPSDAEWKKLEMALGMSQADADDKGWRGTNEGSKLAGNAGLWYDGDLENDAGFGTSGFTALPGGSRYYKGTFNGIGDIGSWWSATGYYTSYAWFRNMSCDFSYVHLSYTYKDYGFSVRCVRD